MLSHIHNWNFAIVEQLDIEFESGLTVMTGETGAGKSILLDALGLVLGDRADTSVIRHGTDKAEISVTFNTTDCPQAQAWLEANEMASDNECIIRRTIARKGSSSTPPPWASGRHCGRSRRGSNLEALRPRPSPRHAGRR